MILYRLQFSWLWKWPIAHFNFTAQGNKSRWYSVMNNTSKDCVRLPKSFQDIIRVPNLLDYWSLSIWQWTYYLLWEWWIFCVVQQHIHSCQNLLWPDRWWPVKYPFETEQLSRFLSFQLKMKRKNKYKMIWLYIVSGKINNKAVLEPRVSPAFAITNFCNHCNI